MRMIENAKRSNPASARWWAGSVVVGEFVGEPEEKVRERGEILDLDLFLVYRKRERVDPRPARAATPSVADSFTCGVASCGSCDNLPRKVTCMSGRPQATSLHNNFITSIRPRLPSSKMPRLIASEVIFAS
jgi:hypothetical protein